MPGGLGSMPCGHGAEPRGRVARGSGFTNGLPSTGRVGASTPAASGDSEIVLGPVLVFACQGPVRRHGRSDRGPAREEHRDARRRDREPAGRDRGRVDQLDGRPALGGDEPHRGATENGRFRPGAYPSRTWGAGRATAWCSRCAPRISPLPGRGREAPTPRPTRASPLARACSSRWSSRGGRIAARAGRQPRLVIGESVGIRVAPAHTCLFAAASGERLAR